MAALAVLLVTSVVMAWPILSGGYLTYLDNPPHLAEIYDLANGQSWSDLAFCGLPVGSLHSPLWYGLLAAASRAGVPVGPPYALCLWLGLVAPAFAVLWVTRRRVGTAAATTLALIVLAQRPAVVGLGASLGGMWTFYIGCALFVLLADRLTRPVTRPRDAAWLAGLVGFVFITHLFLLVPIAVLIGIHVVARIRQCGRVDRVLLIQLGACAIGVVASAAYWAPHLMSLGYIKLHSQNLTPPAVIARLVVASDILDLLTNKYAAMTPARLISSLPMILLVVAGVGGGLQLHKRKDEIPAYGFTLALIMFVLIAFVGPFLKFTVLGHVSWRMIYFVRLGLILAAVPFVVMLTDRVRGNAGRVATIGAVVLTAALAFWVGNEVRTAVPHQTSPEMTEVRELWSWLAENKQASWGRVYMQDTFMCPPMDRQLRRSHVLSLTSHETGVRQLGAWYGAVPFPTVEWTAGEFGFLFRGVVDTDERITRLLSLMEVSNSTHLVVGYPKLADFVAKSGRLTQLHHVGRFTVFTRKTDGTGWAEGAAARYGDDRIDIEASSVPTGGRITVKTAYHPFWRLDGPDGAIVSSTANGLIQIENVYPRPTQLKLSFEPPRWPLVLTVLGFGAILLLTWRKAP